MGQAQTKASQKEMEQKGGELMQEYKSLTAGKERLSVNKFRHHVRNSKGETDRRSIIPEEEKLKEMFGDKKTIEFLDFLKWKIATETDGTGLAEVLKELFEEIDDGDGFLTPQELITLEGTLNVTITEGQAEEIIRTYDMNGDGKMDLDDFVLYKSNNMGIV
jgi:Ca2+-binding EF-hand superfamily protein